MEYTRRIDGFRIFSDKPESEAKEEAVRNKGNKDLTIVYTSKGEKFTESKYHNVSESAIKQIKEKLMESLIYNLNVECLSQAIALPTLVFQVEEIIKNCNNF